jgi:hypothetical protein
MNKNIFKHLFVLASLTILMAACSHHGTQEFEIIDVDTSNDVSMESFSIEPSADVSMESFSFESDESAHVGFPVAGLSVEMVEMAPSHNEYMDDDVVIEEGEFFEVTPL